MNTATESGIFPRITVETFENDADLVQGMLASHPLAWKAFQDRFDRLILRCITKVTRRFASIVSADDVREIYASLYVALVASDMHKLRSFEPERGNRFSSWIGLLAINASYDYLRSLKREPQKEVIDEAMDLICDMPDPFEMVAELERATIAQTTLEEFSDKDRQFAALYFGEGLDPQVIADKMNISVKTVYSKKHKIQSRLEHVLSRRIAA